MSIYIGKRVRVKQKSMIGSYLQGGAYGTIVKLTVPMYEEDSYKVFVGVEFDKPMGGHDCDGTARNDHGYYIMLGDLDMIEDKIKKGDIVVELRTKHRGIVTEITETKVFAKWNNDFHILFVEIGDVLSLKEFKRLEANEKRSKNV